MLSWLIFIYSVVKFWLTACKTKLLKKQGEGMKHFCKPLTYNSYCIIFWNNSNYKLNNLSVKVILVLRFLHLVWNKNIVLFSWVRKFLSTIFSLLHDSQITTEHNYTVILFLFRTFQDLSTCQSRPILDKSPFPWELNIAISGGRQEGACPHPEFLEVLKQYVRIPRPWR